MHSYGCRYVNIYVSAVVLYWIRHLAFVWPLPLAPPKYILFKIFFNKHALLASHTYTYTNTCKSIQMNAFSTPIFLGGCETFVAKPFRLFSCARKVN